MSFITAIAPITHSTIVPGTYDVFSLVKREIDVSIVTGEPVRSSTVAVNASCQGTDK